MTRFVRAQFFALLLGLPLIIGLAACDSDDTNNQVQGPGNTGGNTPVGTSTVTITATDFQFSPSTIEATAGSTLTVVLQNQGSQPHAIAFTLPAGAATMDQVAPGGTGTMSLSVPTTPGSYNFFCPVDGHASLGMTGSLNVTAAAGTTGTTGDTGSTPIPEPGPGPTY